MSNIVFAGQEAYEVGLRWYPGDPVSLSAIVLDTNWAGTYTAKVRKFADPDSTELATLTVTATYSAGTGDTTFTWSLTDAASDAIAAGKYWWSCREVAGVTRFSGPVEVTP